MEIATLFPSTEKILKGGPSETDKFMETQFDELFRLCQLLCLLYKTLDEFHDLGNWGGGGLLVNLEFWPEGLNFWAGNYNVLDIMEGLDFPPDYLTDSDSKTWAKLVLT